LAPFLLAPAILLSMLWSGVEWRGREYRLGANAKLALTRKRAVEVSARWADTVLAKIRGA
jgi:hypothetical protein